VIEKRGESLFDLLTWLIFTALIIAGGVSCLTFEDWWIALILLLGGLIWAILAFRVVSPAFAGLVFWLGGRVIISETIRYFRIVDDQEQDISSDEFNDPAFDPEAPDVKSVVISVEYLTKKEGWTIVFPIIESIMEISLRQHREEINKKETGENDEAYLDRAESIATAEGINIFPKIFYSYKIINPGKVFELGGGIDSNGDSPFLAEMLHDLIIGGTRGVLAKMELTKILSRETIDKRGQTVPIDEEIRTEIINTPNFGRLGVELLIIRIEDIKFKKDAQDVLDALENVKKQKLEKEAKIIEAEKRLEIQKKDSEILVNKSEAELTEARNKAAALNAAIAAFVGKKLEDPTIIDDGKAYANYQIGLAVAKSLETGTKVIIPASDISKTLAGLVNVFDASKPN